MSLTVKDLKRLLKEANVVFTKTHSTKPSLWELAAQHNLLSQSHLDHQEKLKQNKETRILKRNESTRANTILERLQEGKIRVEDVDPTPQAAWSNEKVAEEVRNAYANALEKRKQTEKTKRRNESQLDRLKVIKDRIQKGMKQEDLDAYGKDIAWINKNEEKEAKELIAVYCHTSTK
jgi:hypothetical protein